MILETFVAFLSDISGDNGLMISVRATAEREFNPDDIVL